MSPRISDQSKSGVCCHRLLGISATGLLQYVHQAWACCHFLLFSRMRLKVRLTRGESTFLRTGRLWYQKVLVGGFMRSRLPWASSSFTGSICRRLCFPRASLCLKTKSRAAPRETEAMGDRGSSSLSSSRCSPMWSWPSWYLFTKTKLNVWPVVFVTASRMYSKVGVHGQAERVTPE